MKSAIIILIISIILLVVGIVLIVLAKKPLYFKYDTKASMAIGITLLIIGVIGIMSAIIFGTSSRETVNI